MNFKLVKKILLPQSENGVDWSRPRTLIAQFGSKRVWWRPGHSGWAGVGCRDYYPGVLHFEDVNDPTRRGMNSPELKEGGRVSRETLKECGVDALMGAPVAEQWKPGTSVIVEE
jgi:hypothetical protein